MEKSYQNLLLRYLDKNYYLKNNTFFERPEKQEWGKNIVCILSKVLYFDFDYCESGFKNWAHGKGFPEDENLWNRSYSQRRLNTQYHPELNNDYKSYLGCDWQSKMIASLYSTVSKEIESKFLDSLIDSINTIDEFINIMKCEGYDLAPPLYNSDDLIPRRSFVSITYNELILERQNNKLWQTWLKSRQ